MGLTHDDHGSRREAADGGAVVQCGNVVGSAWQGEGDVAGGRAGGDHGIGEGGQGGGLLDGHSDLGTVLRLDIAIGIAEGHREVGGLVLDETSKGRSGDRARGNVHSSGSDIELLERGSRGKGSAWGHLGGDLQASRSLDGVAKVNDGWVGHNSNHEVHHLGAGVDLSICRQQGHLDHSGRPLQSCGQGRRVELVSKGIRSGELTSVGNSRNAVRAGKGDGRSVQASRSNGHRVRFQVDPIDVDGDKVGSSHSGSHAHNVLPTDVPRGSQHRLNVNNSLGGSDGGSGNQNWVGGVVDGLVSILIIGVDLVVSKEVPLAQCGIVADLGQGGNNLRRGRQRLRGLDREVSRGHSCEAIAGVHDDVHSVQDLRVGVLEELGGEGYVVDSLSSLVGHRRLGGEPSVTSIHGLPGLGHNSGAGSDNLLLEDLRNSKRVVGVHREGSGFPGDHSHVSRAGGLRSDGGGARSQNLGSLPDNSERWVSGRRQDVLEWHGERGPDEGHSVQRDSESDLGWLLDQGLSVSKRNLVDSLGDQDRGEDGGHSANTQSDSDGRVDGDGLAHSSGLVKEVSKGIAQGEDIEGLLASGDLLVGNSFQDRLVRGSASRKDLHGLCDGRRGRGLRNLLEAVRNIVGSGLGQGQRHRGNVSRRSPDAGKGLDNGSVGLVGGGDCAGLQISRSSSTHNVVKGIKQGQVVGVRGTSVLDGVGVLHHERGDHSILREEGCDRLGHTPNLNEDISLGSKGGKARDLGANSSDKADRLDALGSALHEVGTNVSHGLLSGSKAQRVLELIEKRDGELLGSADLKGPSGSPGVSGLLAGGRPSSDDTGEGSQGLLRSKGLLVKGSSVGHSHCVGARLGDRKGEVVHTRFQVSVRVGHRHGGTRDGVGGLHGPVEPSGPHGHALVVPRGDLNGSSKVGAHVRLDGKNGRPGEGEDSGAGLDLNGRRSGELGLHASGNVEERDADLGSSRSRKGVRDGVGTVPVVGDEKAGEVIRWIPSSLDLLGNQRGSATGQGVSEGVLGSDQEGSGLPLDNDDITSNSRGCGTKWSGGHDSLQALRQEETVDGNRHSQGSGDRGGVGDLIHIGETVPGHHGGVHDGGSGQDLGSHSDNSRLVNISIRVPDSDLQGLRNTSSGSKDVAGHRGHQHVWRSRVHSQQVRVPARLDQNGSNHGLHDEVVRSRNSGGELEVHTLVDDADHRSEGSHRHGDWILDNESVGKVHGGQVGRDDVREGILEDHSETSWHASRGGHGLIRSLGWIRSSSSHGQRVLECDSASELEDDVVHSRNVEDEVPGKNISSHREVGGLAQALRQDDGLKGPVLRWHGRDLDDVSVSILWHNGQRERHTGSDRGLEHSDRGGCWVCGSGGDSDGLCSANRGSSE